MWVLILILIGTQPNGTGVVTTTLSTIDFYDQANCEAAVENVKKLPYVVGSICVNRGEAPRAAARAGASDTARSARPPMKLN
jgi:hypothetical protein